MPGLLALVGGAEFTPGNESQDARLAAAAGAGTAYVVSTAAARQGRKSAVANAQRWFSQFDLHLEELPVLTRAGAASPELVERAAGGGFFYLLGGDPGLVTTVLRDSPVWEAMRGAWWRGAVLAGSSAGAMGMCEHVLVRASWPDARSRRLAPGLGLIPGSAVIPHFDTFGKSWKGPADGPETVLIGIDERTAALRQEDTWEVAGPGRVAVITGAATRVFTASQSVEGIPAPRPG